MEVMLYIGLLLFGTGLTVLVLYANREERYEDRPLPKPHPNALPTAYQRRPEDKWFIDSAGRVRNP